ncbi:MAG: SNF2-related protein [Limisphaerales bacterium]
MSDLVLSAELLSRMAGWQVVQEARGLLAAGRVSESNWAPPELRGVVQTSAGTFKTGLLIHSIAHVETLCTCRPARTEGRLCAHAVAVGLHVLQPKSLSPDGPSDSSKTPVIPTVRRDPTPPGSRVKRLRRAASDTGAETVRLRVILPPNLVEAANRGRVTVVIEAERHGRLIPLNTLPLELPIHFDPVDLPLLEEIETVAGEPAGLLLLPTADFARILPHLAGHPRVSLGKSGRLDVRAEPLRLSVKATLEPDGEISLRLSRPVPPSFRAGDRTWSLEHGRLASLALPAMLAPVLRGPVKVTRPQVPAFLSQQWEALRAAADVEADFAPEDFTLEFQAPRFHLELAGGLAGLEATLQAVYGRRTVIAGRLATGEVPWSADPESPKRYTARDLAAEQAAQTRLLRAGFTATDAAGRSRLSGENAVLTFFARDYPRLEREWDVRLEERLERSATTKLERIEPAFRINSSGEQWFDLSVGFASTGGERFSAVDIQRLILSGGNHVRLKNGRLGLLDTGAVAEFQEVLRDCDPRQHPGGFRVPAEQAGFLGASLADHPHWQVEAPVAWRERIGVQRGDTRLECPPLGALESVLRPYQKAGVAWLWFLRRNGFGGILADEMGLGKTLQALTLIQTAGAAERIGPTLIVCPTSLVTNWAEEARKFTPTLRVLTLHGADRHERFVQIAQSDLVITSYALVRRDAERYRGVEFDTVALDEAQHIKNRATQNAQAVKSIRSRHRLVLTGTPLENSVLDLWSIFDFLMPGYLGGAKDFRERYEQPIARDRDAAVQARLARRVRPFLLRRLKRDVAADLPEKIEQVAYCELTAPQAAVYRQLLEAGRREVLEAAGPQGLAKSRMLVLTTLLRLRQVCCDLRLLKLPDLDPATASGKVDLFAELLEEVIDGGHRVLVFSQFTTMLGLLRERLEAEGVGFCYLDGSTGDRAGVVRQFQTRSEIPVFLISLKAGGTGLNLTGADTVIHFDPWWNPAVEAQATDRAHRIGQTRVVTSYKLIARGTVEEKILKLQARKRATLQAMLGDEEQFTGTLDWEEIQELLTD